LSSAGWQTSVRCFSRRSQTELPPATLAGWIVDDRLPVRFQLQLHKILWGDERSR
jgi:organic radical activating enzyme